MRRASEHDPIAAACSTSVSSSTVVSVVSRPRSWGGVADGGKIGDRSRARSAMQPVRATGRSTVSMPRSSRPPVVTGAGSSTTRCSTRPVSVVSDEHPARRPSGSTSLGNVPDARLRDSDGYCTTATFLVGYEPGVRTARCRTSSRSTASIEKRPGWHFFSAAESGKLGEAGRRTSGNRHRSGIRPALVCGWAIRPISSSAAMSLRIVAGETPRLCRSTSALLPTGSWVAMKSSTMARRTSSLRSSVAQGAGPFRSVAPALGRCARFP